MLYVFIIIISVIAIIIFWDFFMKVLGVLFFLIISIIALLIFNYFGIGIADIARFIVGAIVLVISSLVNIASNFGNIFVTNIKKLIKFIGVTFKEWQIRKIANFINTDTNKLKITDDNKYSTLIYFIKNYIIEEYSEVNIEFNSNENFNKTITDIYDWNDFINYFEIKKQKNKFEINIKNKKVNIFISNYRSEYSYKFYSKRARRKNNSTSNRGWKTRKLRNNRNHENSKYYKNNNIEEKYMSSVIECKNKINEIKEIIKDFDYSDKKTYEEATSKIEKDLEELENKDISVSGVNEIIDEINETYRNAYKKKNNVSALSYIMETDEDIDLIKKIDIDNL